MEWGDLDFSFGLDNPDFSDKTLQLHIIGDAPSHRLRNVKLRRCNTTLDTTLSQPPRVKTIHITSLILAARSPFFRKLFSNGMRESEQKHVTLRIEAIEEVSFMNLLMYVYSNNLPITVDALLDLCFTADKFEVDSCSRDCTRALQKRPMTCESASIYLDLPPCLLMSPSVQPLIYAAKQFLVAKFKDFDKFKNEVLDLPLLGLEAVISNDNLQVTSEIVVYNSVLAWVRKHYPNMEERREMLKTHLLHLIRFPYMTTTELIKDVQTCKDIDTELASKIVIHALSFKAATCSHQRRCLAAEEDNTPSRQFVERAYLWHRPIKLVEVESHLQCVVYHDLTKKELKRMFPDGNVWSETFRLGMREFGLSANCSRAAPSFQHKFWLALYLSKSSTCTVEYEFAVRTKPLEKFERWFEGIHTFNVGENLKNLHGEDWSHFIGDDSSYFINNILHVRADLTMLQWR